MKKRSLMFLSTALLSVTLLACAPVTSSSTPSSSSSEPSSSSQAPSYTNEEIVAMALHSVKESCYKVKLEEELTLKYPDKYTVDLYQKHELDLGYYYSGDGEVSHSQIKKGTFADLIKGTDEINQNTLKIKEGVLTNYYKDNETGHAYIESINVLNELIIQTVGIQDMETGEFTPILYDDYFINPFELVEIEDLTYVDDHTLTLDPLLARIVLICYNGVGVNAIESATITLDDNYRPLKLDCVIPDEKGETYTRTNTFKVDFYGYDEAEFNHVSPYTNENPALEEAFAKYDGLVNYTYVKEVGMDGIAADRIEGYFTLDTVYFHHGTLEDGKPYMFGSDYDYKCLLNEEGIYDVYEFTYNEDETYSWKQIYATPVTPYTVETLEEIGPTFYNLSTAIFKSIGNNQYTVEPEILPVIGQYFDFGVLSVESYILEIMTNGCIITLDDANNIVDVEVTSYFQACNYTFTYSYMNIGKTIIPDWMDTVNS